MMDEYKDRYNRQMDQIMISEEADEKILNDLLKHGAQQRQPFMKQARRSLSAAAVAGIVVLASSATVCAGVVIHGTIVKSQKAEEPVAGVGAHVDLDNSYYYDLLAGADGSIYALTDNDYDQILTEEHAVVWKSTDQADTWESVLAQPNELSEESYIVAGDLQEGAAGIEALVLVEEHEDAQTDPIYHVYQIQAEDYVEYDMTQVLAELGEHLFNVKYVNEHIIALVGTTECLLYDTDAQEIVKSLPYDLTMGCLLTEDQFLLYGKDIYSCVDQETLEEQEPEAGLREFVQTMYEYNDSEVFPQMAALDDTVVCVVKSGIYEYQNGETTQMKELAGTPMNDGHASNGLMPMCKGRDGKYYVCKFSDDGMTLWQVDQES